MSVLRPGANPRHGTDPKVWFRVARERGPEAVHQTLDGVVEQQLLLNVVIEHLSVSDGRRPVGVLINARLLNTFTKRTAGVDWPDELYGHAPSHLRLRQRQQSRRRGARNLETQLGILADHGIREDLIFSDVASGRTMNRTGWLDLMSRIQPGDTIVVAFLDRFSRNFEEGVRIQAELTGRDIGIVAVRENIDTRADGNAAAKFFRRSMLAQGAYQVDSASERIKLGLERARTSGKQVGRPPALTLEQVEQCRRMAEEGAGLRQIARVMTCSPATVKKALAAS